MATRAEIIEEARTWLGTPFKHQGRIKGVGCDCAGMLVGIAERFGIVPRVLMNYSRLPDTQALQKTLDEQLERIDLEDAREGDVVVLRIAGRAQHLGLLTDKGIIHSYTTIGKVVEHRLDNKWKRRMVHAYHIPFVED